MEKHRFQIFFEKRAFSAPSLRLLLVEGKYKIYAALAKEGGVELVEEGWWLVAGEDENDVGVESALDLIQEGVPVRLVFDEDGNVLVALDAAAVNRREGDVKLVKGDDEGLLCAGLNRTVEIA